MIERHSVQLARLHALEGRADLALARRDAARKELDTAATQLDTVRAEANENPKVLTALHGAEAELWEQRAALAAAEGHTLDASAMLLTASALAPKRKELAEKAQALWRQAGGTPESWALLTAAQAKPAGATVATEQSGWEKVSTVLKPFDLGALDGRRWTLDDLKGKVAFVNVWATWCGPCREELPQVQKLHERLKDRKDVVLITLDVDADIGPVAPFTANTHYSFPVLLADAYIRDLWKDSVAIPRNWILDRDGTVRYEQMGFDPKAAGDWTDGVLKLIDRLTQETVPPGAHKPAQPGGKP
jgi:thiol-disulfide isomerase/thioredoxin